MQLRALFKKLHCQSAFLTAFLPVLTTISILTALNLTSCKTPIVPPDDWPPDGPDTTSHDFVWQIDTIGVQGVLYDVAIINDTLAYAVGEIYLNDSTEQIDPQSYSLAIWNGVNWTAKRLYDTGNQLIPAIRGVFAFSATDVWLADGGVHRWNGVSQQASQSYSRIDLIGGAENGQSVDKLWGIGSTDIYGVGRIGLITHFNGTSWEKIESGKSGSLRFTDVWGAMREGALVCCRGLGFFR